MKGMEPPMNSITSKIQYVMNTQSYNYMPYSDLLLYVSLYFPYKSEKEENIKKILNWLVRTNVVKEIFEPVMEIYYYAWTCEMKISNLEEELRMMEQIMLTN